MNLHWYTIRFALIGIPEREATVALVDLVDELAARQHLHDIQASHDTVNHRILVQVNVQGIDANSAANGTAEELLGVAVAIIKDFTKISVGILEVESQD